MIAGQYANNCKLHNFNTKHCELSFTYCFTYVNKGILLLLLLLLLLQKVAGHDANDCGLNNFNT